MVAFDFCNFMKTGCLGIQRRFSLVASVSKSVAFYSSPSFRALMAATFLSCAWSITPCYLNIFISHSLGGISVWFSHTLHFYIDHLVQSLSHVQLFATPWTAACQASLSITNSWSLLKLMSIESVTPSNHLILCHPLLFLPSIFPSIRVFSNESVLRIRWPKYWSFSFSVSPFNEYSGLISFRVDVLDLLAVQGTLKSLL